MTTSDNKLSRQGESARTRVDRNKCYNAHTHLVRVFKGKVEVELSQDQKLTLHHAVPQVPELLVTF